MKLPISVILAMPFAFLLLSACSTKVIHVGDEFYDISCLSNQENCIQKAEAICGEPGYRKIAQSTGDPYLNIPSSHIEAKGSKPRDRYNLSIKCYRGDL